MNEFETKFERSEFRGLSDANTYGLGFYAIAWAIFAGMKLIALAIRSKE